MAKNANKYYFVDKNGKEYVLNFTGLGDKYKTDNAFRVGQKKHVAVAAEYLIKNGRMPNEVEYMKALDAAGVSGGRGAYSNIKEDLNTFLEKNGTSLSQFEYDMGTAAEPEDPTHPMSSAYNQAYNQYYRGLYSLGEGTEGRQMYDQLSQAYMNQANADLQKIDLQAQASAYQQAQTVKQITDQVRAERMARLRSGMSESQIANQDMQMLMANVNALNQNAQMMNQQRTDAMFNVGAARDQAYLEYLNQANQRGQVATGMYAADSGNAIWNAYQYMNKTGKPFAESLDVVTGRLKDNKTQ